MATTNRNTTTIEWPTAGHFTINDLLAKYPSVVPITLRFRVNKALVNNEISVIGKIKPEIGRPRLVFVKGQASKEVREAAYKAGVLPPSETTTATVDVVEAKSEKKVIKASTPAAVATV